MSKRKTTRQIITGTVQCFFWQYPQLYCISAHFLLIIFWLCLWHSDNFVCNFLNILSWKNTAVSHTESRICRYSFSMKKSISCFMNKIAKVSPGNRDFIRIGAIQSFSFDKYTYITPIKIYSI